MKVVHANLLGIDGLYLYNGNTLVGKISKAALWIKEGNLLKEEDFNVGGGIQDPSFVPEKGKETRTYWGDRVKILSEKADWQGSWECEYLDEAELNHSRQCVKGDTYWYHTNVLGYTTIPLIKVKCGNCQTYH